MGKTKTNICVFPSVEEKYKNTYSSTHLETMTNKNDLVQYYGELLYEACVELHGEPTLKDWSQIPLAPTATKGPSILDAAFVYAGKLWPISSQIAFTFAQPFYPEIIPVLDRAEDLGLEKEFTLVEKVANGYAGGIDELLHNIALNPKRYKTQFPTLATKPYRDNIHHVYQSHLKTKAENSE